MNQINQLFDLLDKWRHFPNYQLERRVDIFFALYLKDILWHKYQFNADAIIPEFPVHRGSIYPDENDNKSVKIDYVAVDQSKKEVLLIELKTDMRSRRQTQDDYLLKAQKLNIPGLIDGLLKIYKATRQKVKYQCLFTELENLGWLQKTKNAYLNIGNLYKISVIYIQPTTDSKKEIFICFEEIIELLNTMTDDLSNRFVQSLKEWRY
ncbi:MAG: hypothetical protein AB7E36_00840 [Salinivirgaceae bacterium]